MHVHFFTGVAFSNANFKSLCFPPLCALNVFLSPIKNDLLNPLVRLKLDPVHISFLQRDGLAISFNVTRADMSKRFLDERDEILIPNAWGRVHFRYVGVQYSTGPHLKSGT